MAPSFKPTSSESVLTNDEHHLVAADSMVTSFEDIPISEVDNKSSREDRQTLNAPNFVANNPVDPVQSHDMPTLFESPSSAKRFADQTNYEPEEHKSTGKSVATSITNPASAFFDQNILTSLQSSGEQSANQRSTSPNHYSSFEKPSMLLGCYEEEIVDEKRSTESNVANEDDGDLDFQLYLSSDDECEQQETTVVEQNSQHQSQQQKNVEENPSCVQIGETAKQMMPSEYKHLEQTSKLPEPIHINQATTEAQPVVIADESHFPEPDIFEAKKSSSEIQVPSSEVGKNEPVPFDERRSSEQSSDSPLRINRVDVTPVTPLNDGSDSSEVEIHLCHECGDEFRYNYG